jgi:hypothetical protein
MGSKNDSCLHYGACIGISVSVVSVLCAAFLAGYDKPYWPFILHGPMAIVVTMASCSYLISKFR